MQLHTKESDIIDNSAENSIPGNQGNDDDNVVDQQVDKEDLEYVSFKYFYLFHVKNHYNIKINNNNCRWLPSHVRIVRIP